MRAEHSPAPLKSDASPGSGQLESNGCECPGCTHPSDTAPHSAMLHQLKERFRVAIGFGAWPARPGFFVGCTPVAGSRWGLQQNKLACIYDSFRSCSDHRGTGTPGWLAHTAPAAVRLCNPRTVAEAARACAHRRSAPAAHNDSLSTQLATPSRGRSQMGAGTHQAMRTLSPSLLLLPLSAPASSTTCSILALHKGHCCGALRNSLCAHRLQ